jgi:cell division protein FtsA
MAIFKDGFIRYSTYIPIGGKLVTTDIKNSFSLTFSEAELLKTKSGSACAELIKNNEIAALPGNYSKEVSVKALAQIIQARTEEMLEWILAELENSGISEIPGGLVLTGGGSLLKDLPDLAKIMTGMPVRMGFPVTKISKSVHHDLMSQENATRIGLLIKGYEKLSQMHANGK